jgi:hypothetical protein
MFTRILTSLERRRVAAYLKVDGEKDTAVRVLTTRARQNLPQIKADLDLLEKLVSTYDRHVKKD